MARKTGQIIGRGPRTYVVRIFVSRDAETKKRKYISKTIHDGLRDAQAHLNKMLGIPDHSGRRRMIVPWESAYRKWSGNFRLGAWPKSEIKHKSGCPVSRF